MIKLTTLLATSATLMAGAMANAQWDVVTNDKPTLGVEVGVMYPSNATTRDLFGSQIMRYGLAQVGGRSKKSAHFYNSLSVINVDHNGNKLFLLPYVAGYELQLTQNRYASSVPFIRAEAGYAYYDYSVNVASSGNIGGVQSFASGGTTHFGAKRGGPTAAVEAGLAISNRWRISARYNWFAKYDDLDFSGAQLSVAYGFGN